MSRYIDADALKAFIKDKYFQCDMPKEWGNGVMWATSQINHYCNKADTPTIEPKQGEWIFKTVFPNDKSEFPMGYLVCSVCGSHHSNSTPCNYCDNCGAKMKGADDE